MKLTKAWNAMPAGTEITADPAEAQGGAVLVDPARFEHLATGGFFTAPEPPPDERFDAHRSAGGIAPATREHVRPFGEMDTRDGFGLAGLAKKKGGA